MKLKIDVKEIGWWLWAITLVFIVAALGGWLPGYYVVIGLSGLQVLYFTWRERSLIAFPPQVRIVYFVFTLFGLWAPLRIPIYGLLLIGTTMVVLFDRCVIALVLKSMPWNRSVRFN